MEAHPCSTLWGPVSNKPVAGSSAAEVDLVPGAPFDELPDTTRERIADLWRQYIPLICLPYTHVQKLFVALFSRHRPSPFPSPSQSSSCSPCLPHVLAPGRLRSFRTCTQCTGWWFISDSLRHMRHGEGRLHVDETPSLSQQCASGPGPGYGPTHAIADDDDDANTVYYDCLIAFAPVFPRTTKSFGYGWERWLNLFQRTPCIPSAFQFFAFSETAELSAAHLRWLAQVRRSVADVFAFFHRRTYEPVTGAYTRAPWRGDARLQYTSLLEQQLPHTFFAASHSPSQSWMRALEAQYWSHCAPTRLWRFMQLLWRVTPEAPLRGATVRLRLPPAFDPDGTYAFYASVPAHRSDVVSVYIEDGGRLYLMARLCLQACQASAVTCTVSQARARSARREWSSSVPSVPTTMQVVVSWRWHVAGCKPPSEPDDTPADWLARFAAVATLFTVSELPCVCGFSDPRAHIHETQLETVCSGHRVSAADDDRYTQQTFTKVHAHLPWMRRTHCAPLLRCRCAHGLYAVIPHDAFWQSIDHSGMFSRGIRQFVTVCMSIFGRDARRLCPGDRVAFTEREEERSAYVVRVFREAHAQSLLHANDDDDDDTVPPPWEWLMPDKDHDHDDDHPIESEPEHEHIVRTYLFFFWERLMSSQMTERPFANGRATWTRTTTPRTRTQQPTTQARVLDGILACFPLWVYTQFAQTFTWRAQSELLLILLYTCPYAADDLKTLHPNDVVEWWRRGLCVVAYVALHAIQRTRLYLRARSETSVARDVTCAHVFGPTHLQFPSAAERSFESHPNGYVQAGRLVTLVLRGVSEHIVAPAMRARTTFRNVADALRAHGAINNKLNEVVCLYLWFASASAVEAPHAYFCVAGRQWFHWTYLVCMTRDCYMDTKARSPQVLNRSAGMKRHLKDAPSLRNDMSTDDDDDDDDDTQEAAASVPPSDVQRQVCTVLSQVRAYTPSIRDGWRRGVAESPPGRRVGIVASLSSSATTQGSAWVAVVRRVAQSEVGFRVWWARRFRSLPDTNVTVYVSPAEHARATAALPNAFKPTSYRMQTYEFDDGNLTHHIHPAAYAVGTGHVCSRVWQQACVPMFRCVTTASSSDGAAPHDKDPVDTVMNAIQAHARACMNGVNPLSGGWAMYGMLVEWQLLPDIVYGCAVPSTLMDVFRRGRVQATQPPSRRGKRVRFEEEAATPSPPAPRGACPKKAVPVEVRLKRQLQKHRRKR